MIDHFNPLTAWWSEFLHNLFTTSSCKISVTIRLFLKSPSDHQNHSGLVPDQISDFAFEVRFLILLNS